MDRQMEIEEILANIEEILDMLMNFWTAPGIFR